MNNNSGIVEALKEFFLEILGYLLPGLFALFTLWFITIGEISDKVFNTLFTSRYSLFIFIILGYILGYIIYGISIIRDKLLIILQISIVEKTKKEIINSEEFKLTKKTLKKLIKGFNENTTSLSQVRNYAMAFVPKADRKIYTFMFRAELANHVGIVCLIAGFGGVLNFMACKTIGYKIFFKTSIEHFIVYLSLLISVVFLYYTRKRFYKIAQKIAFPIFLAKHNDVLK